MNTRMYLPVIIVLVGLALIAYAIAERASMNAEPITFNLSEFGVALTIPGSLSELRYEAKDATPGPGTMLHMIVNNTCEVGTFYEIQKNAIAKSGTPWTEETLEQFQIPLGSNPARVKEFTDFYLVFEPSQEPCSSDTKQAQDETDKRLELWNALSNARYMLY